MKDKLNFSIDVSGIGEWVNENGQELLEENILASETISYIEVMPGVKYKEQLKIFTTDANIQAGACGTPTSSGTTAITDKDVEVKDFMVYEELCPKDLNKTSLQLSQSQGMDTDLPFEAQYVAMKAKKIALAIENALWVQASGATNIAGFINQFDDDSDVTDVVFDFGATGLTNAELIAGLETVVDEIPENIQGNEDLTLFLGHDLFRKISKAYLKENNVQLTKFDFNGVDVFEIPGAENVRIRPVNGLNKANNTDQRVVITPASNLLYVCDLEGEESAMWYSQDDRTVKYSADFKYGPAYKYGSAVVLSAKA